MDSNPAVSMFQPGSINVENPLQNLEEEEDLEEQKRRQEEIQSYLTKAMDEFNYDDQSTMNSSTNVSMDETYQRKYKDAEADDQLKVLYEVRVREVKNLAEQLENVKAQFAQHKDAMAKKLMLVECEKDKAQISLTQAQELLVNKREDMQKMNHENDNLKKSIDIMKRSLQTMEDDNNSLKQVNRELLEQLNIMQNGYDPISERHLQENHNQEISKMQAALENKVMKLQRKENEIIELEKRLKANSQEKDDMIREKSIVINELTYSLETAQHQSRELLQLVDTLSQENHNLKIAASNLDLASTLQSGLSDKTEIIKVLQKELEKASAIRDKHLIELENLESKNTNLVKQYEILENNFEHCKSENHNMLKTNEIMEHTLKTQYEQLASFKEQLDKLGNVNAENEILQKRIHTLQQVIKDYEDKVTKDNSVQVSQIMTSFCEQNELHKEERDKLEEQLVKHKEDVIELKAQLDEYEKEIEKLKTEVSLQKERDQLIKTLQEKALKFEQIIFEKQNKPEHVDVEVNTEAYEDLEELFKAKYETELIEKEIQMRLALEKDFETKYQKTTEKKTLQEQDCLNCDKYAVQIQLKNMELKDLQQNKPAEIINEIKECTQCPPLIAKLSDAESAFQRLVSNYEKIQKQQYHDRELLAKILDDWKEKFVHLEQENQYLKSSVIQATQAHNEIEQKLKIRELGDAKLYEGLRKEAENFVKHWTEHAHVTIKEFAETNVNKIHDSKRKIDLVTKNADKKVKEIEKRYNKCRQAVEMLNKASI